MDVISRIISKLVKKELTVFCGAGVSFNSGIPTVGSIDDYGHIQDGILTYLMRELGFSADEMNRFLRGIPFEAFIQTLLENNMPIAAFAQIFCGKPTYIHHLIAELFRCGSLEYIGTTNFDMCFESALEMASVSYSSICGLDELDCLEEKLKRKNVIYKLHGSVHQLDNMGITIRSIAQKNNLDIRKKIAHAFFSGAGSIDTILVLGYSCSDVFDLVKWVPQMPRKMNIIYINHTSGRSISYAKNIYEYEKPSKMFSGHNLEIVNCDTERLVKAIGKQISFNKRSNKELKNSWQISLKDCIKQFTGFALAKVRGNLYYLCQEFEKSLKCHEEALLVASADIQRLIASRNIGFSLYRLNRIEEAFSVMSKSYRLAKKLGEDIHRTNILMNMAACYADRNKFKTSINCYMEALSLAENGNMDREKCFILGNIGLAHAYAGRYTESVRYTVEGINLAHLLGEVETEGKFYANLGEAYLSNGEYDSAIEATRVAIDIAKQIGDIHGEINRKTNLLVAELRSGNADAKRCREEAEVLLQQAIEYENSLYAANCHQLIGDCHRVDGNDSSAIDSWKTAKEIYDLIVPSKGTEVLKKICELQIQ